MTTEAAGSRARFEPPFPIVEGRLHPPSPPGATVPRTALLERVEHDPRRRVVAVVGPPGYGKTTLLAQWAARHPGRVAWLALDEGDDDPLMLLASLAAALDRVEPIDPGIGRLLAGTGDRLLTACLPRLAASLHAWDRPALVVLDDVHRVADATSLALLDALIRYAPDHVRIAVAARREPDLALPRLRVQDELVDIGPVDLALSDEETAALADALGCPLGPEAARDLADRTEGWAAAIALASRAMARSGVTGVVPDGGERHVTAYLRAEVGRHLSDEDLALLTRTSILAIVEPGVAAELSGVPDAASRLGRLAREQPLVSELGGPVPAYRYHRLLREYLIAELRRREPAALPDLHCRAATWYRGAGMGDAAVRHFLEAGRRDLAAAMVVETSLPTFLGGRVTTLDRWLAAFEPVDFERHPPLAASAAWIAVMTGRADVGDRMAEILERTAYEGPSGDGSVSFASQRAIVAALMGRHGPRRVVEDASFALDAEPANSPWRSIALGLLGTGHRMLGEHARADECFEAAARLGDELRGPRFWPLVEVASSRLRDRDVAGARAALRTAGEVAARQRVGTLVQGLRFHATSALVAIAVGDHEAARRSLVAAQVLRPLAHHAAPWHSVAALLDLVRAHLALSDTAGAQVVLREAEQIVRVRPSLGTLVDDLVALRRQLAGASATLAGSSALTSAELRVLVFLPTYLSFQEIAERLGVSRNTVKTHAVAIYGKLWASSRGEAVERAVELGLLEPYPVLHRAAGDAPGGAGPGGA